MTVQEVCREIREKNGETAGGVDHSLFYPDNKKWLALGRTLDFYDIKTGDTLEYKKKHRILKVKMMDDSIKTFLIDESLPVKNVVEYVGQKLGTLISYLYILIQIQLIIYLYIIYILLKINYFLKGISNIEEYSFAPPTEVGTPKEKKKDKSKKEDCQYIIYIINNIYIYFIYKCINALIPKI